MPDSGNAAEAGTLGARSANRVAANRRSTCCRESPTPPPSRAIPPAPAPSEAMPTATEPPISIRRRAADAGSPDGPGARWAGTASPCSQPNTPTAAADAASGASRSSGANAGATITASSPTSPSRPSTSSPGRRRRRPSSPAATPSPATATPTPICRTSLSSSGPSDFPNSVNHGGDSRITVSATARNGEEAGATSAATRCPIPSAAPTASNPMIAPIHPGTPRSPAAVPRWTGVGDGVLGLMTARSQLDRPPVLGDRDERDITRDRGTWGCARDDHHR